MGLLSGLNEAKGELAQVLPAAAYLVNISKVEIVPTKKTNDPMFKIQLRIVGGDYDGFPVFDQIVLPNPSMDAFNQNRSLNRIKRLCVAAGVNTETDDETVIKDSLMGCQLQIILGIRKNKETGKDVNSVEDYLPAQ